MHQREAICENCDVPKGQKECHAIAGPDAVLSNSARSLGYRPNGWHCSRPLGHTGEHVACGLNHNLMRWRSDETVNRNQERRSV